LVKTKFEKIHLIVFLLQIVIGLVNKL